MARTRIMVVAVLAALVAGFAGVAPAHAELPVRYVRYTNVNSGKCLDIAFRGDINDSPAVQFTCASAAWFRDDPAGVDTSILVLEESVPMCLEVSAFSTADFATVAQHACNGGPHQQWRLVPSGYTGNSAITRWLRNSYLLQNVHSGKCLEIYAYSTADFASAVQHACHGGWNQLWFLEYYLRY